MQKRITIFLLLLLAAGFALGLVLLFNLRLAVGDVYPEYSSLRADPLGTMAFYESLGRIPGISVRRDFSAENALPDTSRTTYLHLAARREEWEWMPESTVHEIEGFLAHGGRLVVSFFPVSSQSLFSTIREFEHSRPEKKAAGEKAKKKKRLTRERLVEREISLRERWGLEIGLLPLVKGAKGSYSPVTVDAQGESVGGSLLWHSGLIFTNLSTAWQVIFARSNSPVVIERHFGTGQLVFTTDSYFFSNEALSKDSQPEFLSWIIGPSTSVVFDESHFGIVENSGVAVLMKKYHLTGFIVALLFLGALFIWKNSLRFGPLAIDSDALETVTGKEASAGFVNLLRRNVAPGEMIKVCLAEWEKSHPDAAKRHPEKLEQARHILQREENLPILKRNPIKAYAELCRVLKKTS